MEYTSFSVLITVYSKENPEFLNQAIRSVIKQTVTYYSGINRFCSS